MLCTGVMTTTRRGPTGNQGVSGPHPLRRSVCHEIRGNVRFSAPLELTVACCHPLGVSYGPREYTEYGEYMFSKLRAFFVHTLSRLRRPTPVDVIIDERLNNPSDAQAKRIKRRLEQQRIQAAKKKPRTKKRMSSNQKVQR
jgi:hypothetical protein